MQERVQQLEAKLTEVLVKSEMVEKEKCSLREQLEAANSNQNEIKEVLSNFFTPGQISCVLGRKRKVHWSAEDIASAISLKCVSAKAYRYLRNQLKYPLPDISTLRKWAQNFNCDNGILNDVISLMKAKGKDLDKFKKTTVISFDEMKINSTICVDRKLGQIVGPHKYAQVIMARGLFGNWKQPIYYSFDQPMTENILCDVIIRLEESGFHTVAVVTWVGRMEHCGKNWA